MKEFFKDISVNKSFSWDTIIYDINDTSSWNRYCKSDDYYTIFKEIILSILIGEEIILLDYDFTENELFKLTGYSSFEKFQKPIENGKLPVLSNIDDLIKAISNSSSDWKITLFTSGTTGIPKKVSHSFDSITRFVKISKKNENNIWGFAYNPTHMAGIQVFFQALLNGNTIIRLFGLNQNEIFHEIASNGITHISATPTFYRLLLPNEDTFSSLKRLTSGGEKFNVKVFQQLKKIFPNAKFTNVYASTEAGTLFASENDVFTVKNEFEHLISIKDNELLIHNSLMGKSEVNIDSWYKTGDIIEMISRDPLSFRFMNRRSEMINVGGYKVNPHEVEEVILSLSGVKNTRVYSKSNSVLGNIVCCEIVSDSKETNENYIRASLKSKLQEFKIPRVIRFVEELSTTRTGKLKRT